MTMYIRVVCAALALMSSASACRSQATPPEEAQTPTLDVTNWTEKTELFMEYPPLVAGRTALFAVHLTKMADFTPLTAGRPRIELTPESGGTANVLPGA